MIRFSAHRAFGAVIVIAIVAVALVCGPAARAVPAYMFTIVTKGEAVEFRATDTKNAKNTSGVKVAANSQNVTFVEKAADYELTFTMCGKVTKMPFAAKQNQVVITVRGCTSYTFEEK